MPTTTLPTATRAIYAATDRLEQSLAAHRALAALISPALPIAAAELHMNDIEDHLAAIRRKLDDALAVHVAAIERLEFAEEPANDNIDMDEAA